MPKGRSRQHHQALVAGARYRGKYVAFGSDGKNIIASGANPALVVRKARSKGVDIPAIVFVPRKNVAYIY